LFRIILTDLSTVSVLESQDNKNFALRASISKTKDTSSGIIKGLTFKLCGAIGVITKFWELGYIIGPPQLSEYAVEPVGVAMISPSANKNLQIRYSYKHE
jgi:hypothetical protein